MSIGLIRGVRAHTKVLLWGALATLATFGCDRCASPGRLTGSAGGGRPSTVLRKSAPRTLVDPSPERLQLAAEFRRRHPTAGISFDRHTGFAKELSGFVSPAAPEVPNAAGAASAFIRENRVLLGVGETDLGVLRVTEATAQDRGITTRVVRMQQRVEKLPVFEGEIVVQLTAQHSVIAVRSTLKVITAVRGELRITRERALELARELTKDTDGAREPRRELAGLLVYPLGGEGLRAWAVRENSWLVILSAENGETLLLRDEARYGPDAQVFLENEVVNGGVTEIRPLTHLGAATTLSGTRFAVSNRCTPVAVSASQEFRAAPGDVHFDDQMAYYHLEQIASVFEALDVPAPGTPLRVLTCVDWKPCNAAYSPAGCFTVDGTELCGPEQFVIGIPDGGAGCDGPPTCKRPAHYADTMYHEYTHRVIETQAGLNRELMGDSIHEGTADFFSSSVLGNACLGERFKDTACMRDVSVRREFPRDMGDADPHVSGQVWGSALWTLRSRLGKGTAERVVRQGLVGLPADADFSTYAGNMVTQGTAYYSGLLDDRGWHNFFVLLQIAAVMQGTKDAFCSHGIAVPYGSFVDLDVVVPDPGTRASWTVPVPAGMVVDRNRGCHGGWDVLGDWSDLKYFEENRSKLLEYAVDVTGTSLTVTMRTPGGCGEYERIPLKYRLYFAAP